MKRRGEGGVCHPCAYGVFCAGNRYPGGGCHASLPVCPDVCHGHQLREGCSFSQTEGQKILTAQLGAFPGLLKQAKEAPEEMLGLGAPGFDLAGIRHETLYSRLYMS